MVKSSKVLDFLCDKSADLTREELERTIDEEIKRPLESMDTELAKEIAANGIAPVLLPEALLGDTYTVRADFVKGDPTYAATLVFSSGSRFSD